MDSLVFLDIETGGLDKEKDLVSCVGALRLGSGVQVFSGSERGLLLEACAFFDNLPDDSVLVSFNGVSFDLPFVRSACERNRIPFFLKRFKHLDLMPVARIHVAGKLPNGEEGWISKDRACDRMGIYVPKTVNGFKCALIAKGGCDQWEMLDVLAHNAVDLAATAKLYQEFRKQGWV